MEYVNVQYQPNSDDCGLLVIANACELWFGRDPSVHVHPKRHKEAFSEEFGENKGKLYVA